MTETQPPPIAEEPRRRLHLNWVLPALFRPRKAFAGIAAQSGDTWYTPLLILTLTALLAVIVGGPLRQAEALNAQVQPPSDFMYYTPEQQAQFQQAQAATAGTTFVYVFPALVGLVRVWAGWLILGALLHLALTLLGGRWTMRSMMNTVAWSGLPFAIRDLVHTAYFLFGHRLIQAPGLSGLVGSEVGTLGLLAGQVLGLLDIYLVWHVALLVIGIRSSIDPGARKALGSVLITTVVALLIQALPAFLAAKLGSLTIIRPFLF
jgi:hypothetical protein